MNRKYLIAFAVTVAVVGILAFIARSLFETYSRTEPLPPSREARMNEYLALDRWLTEMGRSVRTESYGDLSIISLAEERQIFIQSSLFWWSDEAVEYLVQWVEDGGSLFLALDDFEDYEYRYEEYPALLLERFGVEPGADAGLSDYLYDSRSPTYDMRVSFAPAEDEEALLLKDWRNVTRLLQVNRGSGKLTVTGSPRFLLSWNLEHAPNVRLAYALFAPGPSGAEHGGKSGVLFIRGTTRVQGLVGSLFKRGNLAVLIVSVLVLLVIAFWAVIPRFGLVRGDEERPAKPLRERFLAEGRFLKRYNALEFYRDVYIKEIKRTLAGKEGLVSDDEILKHILKSWEKAKGQKDSHVIEKIFNRKPFTYRDFPKMIIILKGILECI